MNLPTLVELSDVVGHPTVMLTLPSPLHIGVKVKLAFRLRRQNKGRSEALDVAGWWRVSSLSIDATSTVLKQLISVESTAVTPQWKAVKKEALRKPSLAPTRHPRTVVA